MPITVAHGATNRNGKGHDEHPDDGRRKRERKWGRHDGRPQRSQDDLKQQTRARADNGEQHEDERAGAFHERASAG